MDPKFAGKPIAAHFSGRIDIDQMPDTPNRGAHRRAQSETFFRFPDDILLDDVVADFNLASLDLPSLSSSDAAAASMAVDSSKSDSSNGGDKPAARPAGPGPHFRSLSVGADFFEGLEFASGGGDGESERERFGGKPPASSQHRYRHRHSNSMDGSTSSFEADSSGMMIDGVKKAMGPDRLAELALIDPKRAKRSLSLSFKLISDEQSDWVNSEETINATSDRILANRQSAARSKERKIRYTGELERKVQTLQTEATTLSAQVTMLQRDTTGLTVENKELKLRLQAMEQQAHLRDESISAEEFVCFCLFGVVLLAAALNEALREEVHRLKIATGQIPAANGNPFKQSSTSTILLPPAADVSELRYQSNSAAPTATTASNVSVDD
ncbi:Basic-leucine zipper (bZIP) transcription factor family protein [Actinidia rufa]|uniref:Basic-leucine zipper (BZIP) transcription factor family protein n=1 Tax=Actinidia rufa TaxID=165716 RepID=A0A7J0EGJ0_9ERIC|nr:Basic-leucine zipper (bZIP) transcription factor family protein [Actinidia rufa]